MYSTAQCFGKSYEKLAVLAYGACTLAVLGSMQPEHKIPKSPVQYSIILNCYIDTIFVLPDLGADQGMSIKSRDQNIFGNFASTNINYGP